MCKFQAQFNSRAASASTELTQQRKHGTKKMKMTEIQSGNHSRQNEKNIFSFPILITVRSSQSSSKTQLCGNFNIFRNENFPSCSTLCQKKLSTILHRIAVNPTKNWVFSCSRFSLGLLVKDLILLCVETKVAKGRKNDSLFRSAKPKVFVTSARRTRSRQSFS